MTASGPAFEDANALKVQTFQRGNQSTWQPIEVTMNEHVQAATTKPLFNPLSPEFIRNPYPHYERLRTADPMHLTPFGSYVASRHAEASLCCATSASARTMSSARSGATAPRSWRSRYSAAWGTGCCSRIRRII